MAQRIQTLFLDDIDGGEAEGTVCFGLDGTNYEIDLNAQHSKELQAALSPYIVHARKVSGITRRPVRGGSSTAGPDTKAVRAWAAGQGIALKNRGRVPAGVVAEFLAATAK
jgi:hypothetical protein